MTDEAAMSAKEERAYFFELAKQIIECGDVLNLFIGSWHEIVAGEERNAKLLYLVATTRLFDQCMSAAIKGPSAAGKSNIRKTVLDFFPRQDVVSFTTLSEKALLYYQDDYAHKVLSMGEAVGTEEKSLQDYLLRELISEGILRYPVVQKVEGKGLVTELVVKHGPVVFMVTTTKAALHPENETRMLSVEIDDSEEQTRPRPGQGFRDGRQECRQGHGGLRPLAQLSGLAGSWAPLSGHTLRHRTWSHDHIGQGSAPAPGLLPGTARHQGACPAELISPHSR